MKAKLKEWDKADYKFNLDWLLRSVNTVADGRGEVSVLAFEERGRRSRRVLARASKHIDTSLNMISGRLGLDHDQVFFGRYRCPGDGALPRPA